MILATTLSALALFAPLQDQEPDLDRLLEVARNGSPVVRPQAAQRLLRLGEAAVPRLLAECGDDPARLAALGSDVVEVLGRFESDELRSRVWNALEDRDFPWRPAAARTLSSSAQADETPRFNALLADALATVRVAALGGLEVLDARDQLESVRPLLADPDDRVRRAAASLMATWGELWTLVWLIEDLQRTDSFFDDTTGLAARFEAHRLLTKFIGDDYGYRPDQEPTSPANAAALGSIFERFREIAGGVAVILPAHARAAADPPDPVLGLVVRSCRRGELYMRWDTSDALYVGRSSPARVELPEGSVAQLVAGIRGGVEPLGERRLWGQPGCDSERLILAGASGPESFTISKGPEPVPGLRPKELGRVWAALLETLPEEGEDARLADLRARVRAALAAVGGTLGQR